MQRSDRPIVRERDDRSLPLGRSDDIVKKTAEDPYDVYRVVDTVSISEQEAHLFLTLGSLVSLTRHSRAVNSPVFSLAHEQHKKQISLGGVTIPIVTRGECGSSRASRPRF
jgi:hypothetical protein